MASLLPIDTPNQYPPGEGRAVGGGELAGKNGAGWVCRGDRVKWYCLSVNTCVVRDEKERNNAVLNEDA